ncbi:hypothetical protein RH858_05045 [Halalkaliarchaeum sp. AArc-GB]|uniref:hypothetical protein n=1 Tax=Halalkaliarchaeum sp. AArc-GB TaxID=3074078 RepID=UPI00285D8862|nr:hypothetical protein [Halalkaliarchaeum sp. AArc-GB]MDR5672516.1 hypothetical protein [Halalkaliarchaeum sp. AArc-GB]
MASLRQGLIVFAAVAVGLAIAVAATGGFSTGDVDRVVEIQLDDQSYVDSEAHLDTENCTLEATVTNRYKTTLDVTVSVNDQIETKSIGEGETASFEFELEDSPEEVGLQALGDVVLFEHTSSDFPECDDGTEDGSTDDEVDGSTEEDGSTAEDGDNETDEETDE